MYCTDAMNGRQSERWETEVKGRKCTRSMGVVQWQGCQISGFFVCGKNTACSVLSKLHFVYCKNFMTFLTHRRMYVTSSSLPCGKQLRRFLK